jgi:hypothetical protein
MRVSFSLATIKGRLGEEQSDSLLRISCRSEA